MVDSNILKKNNLWSEMRHLLLILLSLLFAKPCFATPQIAVSLKPIAGLVASLTVGVTTPTVLLPDGASPHNFQLKPSLLRAIQDADLIIWVGPTLETFMSKAISLKPKQTLTLMDIPQIEKLPNRHSHFWQEDEHDDHHDHHHGSVDPHIWLSIANAKKIVDAITEKLIEIDPTNTQRYKNNRTDTIQKLNALFQSMQAELKTIRSKPYLVYHDGYQYLEREFGLNAQGSIIFNPEVPLSAKRLQELKKLIQNKNIHCVFTETEFNKGQIEKKLQSLNVRFSELDPLGVKQNAGQNCYFDTMNDLANTLHQCLSTTD